MTQANALVTFLRNEFRIAKSFAWTLPLEQEVEEWEMKHQQEETEPKVQSDPEIAATRLIKSHQRR